MFRLIKIFLLAHFSQREVWRVRYRNGMESQLLSYYEARGVALERRGKQFIDYSHYNSVR